MCNSGDRATLMIPSLCFPLGLYIERRGNTWRTWTGGMTCYKKVTCSSVRS